MLELLCSLIAGSLKMGKSKDSNRRSIQDISWVWTATKLAISQEKQLPLCPLAPTLTSAFLLSLCFLQSFPSWIETFGRLISLHLFQLWCNCGNNSTTVGWKVAVMSWFLFLHFIELWLYLEMGPGQSWATGALPRFGKACAGSQTPSSQLAFLLLKRGSKTQGAKLEKFKRKLKRRFWRWGRFAVVVGWSKVQRFKFCHSMKYLSSRLMGKSLRKAGKARCCFAFQK